MARGECDYCGSYGNGKITVSVRRYNDWNTARYMTFYFCSNRCLNDYKAQGSVYRYNLEDE